MEIRQLKYFEAVGRTLNFSKAAETLHIAQPPLSRQIQNLEEELGVVLIDRSTRPLKLTDAGAFFLEQSTQLLAKLNEIKKSTQRLAAGHKRCMGVGFVQSIFYGDIPRVIRTFTVENSNIDISLQELTSLEQVDALKSGKIDVGFGRLAIQDEAIENFLLAEEPLVVATSSESPLARLQQTSLNDLSNEVLILYPASPRTSFADQVLRQFKVRGLEVNATYETNALQTAIGLVAAGMGITLVPGSVRLLQRSDIIYIPLSDAGVTCPLIMSVRNNHHSEHLATFRQSIMAHFE